MANASQRNVEAPTKTSNAKVNAINAARAANVKAGKNAYSGGGKKGQIGDSLNATPPTVLNNPTAKDPTMKDKPPGAVAAPMTPASAPYTGDVKTNQPSPASVDATPFTQPQTYEQAQANLAGGGLTGNALAMAQGSLANAYGQTHQSLVASGAAPTSRGEAMGPVQDTLKQYQEPDTAGVDAVFSEDPIINQLMGSVAEMLNPQVQTTSLMQDYKKLQKQSGLDQINAELIDAETIINGTEDDIRNEIQTAGGFGTDSQVQAMSLSRNKNLLKRYNQLVQMKTDAQNNLNTMMNLNVQDKQMAQARVDQKINTMFQFASFRQNAQNAIKEQARWSFQALGADGLYNSVKGDPKRLGNLEQVLGLSPGGMASAAQQAASARALDTAIKSKALGGGNSAPEVKSINGVDMQWNPSTSKWENIGGDTGTDVVQSSRTKDKIDTINTLTKDIKATGPNDLARWDPFSGFTGAQQKFIGSVEQLRSELTLGSLIEAKARGATFGALSEGEMRILDATASKIGTWAIKDPKTGQVKGYNIDDASMKQELDKINQYAKLDYLKKGGGAADVGVQQMPDGHYYTQNSDGTYTQLY